MQSIYRVLSILILGWISLSSHAVENHLIVGRGSTFASDALNSWSESYYKITGLKLDFQEDDSARIIEKLKNGSIQFIATDIPMSAVDLKLNGFVQFPIVVGAVAPVIGIKGLNSGYLKLDGAALADIFQGRIKSWNDERIARLNIGVNLPPDDITVVYRLDGAATTALLTDYLGKVSSVWKNKVGEGTAIKWPPMQKISVKNNQELVKAIQTKNNSIGYADYAYAKKKNLNFVRIQNQDHAFVAPGVSTLSSVVASVNWRENLEKYTYITNIKGVDSWPIAGEAYILMNNNPINKKIAKETLEFFRFGLNDGRQTVINLNLHPLPDHAVKLIEGNIFKKIGLD